MRAFAIPALVAALALSPAAQALSTQLVGSGYSVPVFVTAPANDPRLFIVEKGGVIKVQQGSTVSTFLNISGLVDSGGERGLLGLAFAPDYATSGRFYVNYIDKTTLNTVVAAYTAPNPAGGPADAGSRQPIITIAQPAGRNNHKAGWIGFSPSDASSLYIATGDGGSGNDPENRAQNLNDNLGKMLRITPNTNAPGYTVPASNPFVGVAGNDEIWAYGLRNPWRNSFDRGSGDLYIADVGQGAREEVNRALAGAAGGANYGWRVREGAIATPGVGGPKLPGMIDPVLDYGRALGGSITGGYVVRGALEAELNGLYVFGDFVSGRVFSFNPANPTASFADRSSDFGVPWGGFQLVSFGEDGFGSLYAATAGGSIYRLTTAVPEPASLLLMAGGLLVLLGRRFSRKD